MSIRGWKMRIAILVLAAVLPGARSHAQVFGRAVEDVPPITAIATTPAAPDRPVLAAVDGSESTSWSAAEGSTEAGVIIVLPGVRAIAGVRIQGRVAADSRVSVSWLAVDGPRPFFGGDAVGPFDGEIVLDLSLERAVADRLLVTISGPQVPADAIAEMVPMAFAGSSARRRLSPDDISTGGNPSDIDAAEWLADGDVRTAWRASAAADAAALGESTDALRRAARLTARLPLMEPSGASARWMPGRIVEGEAVFGYDEPIRLQRLRLYLAEAPHGETSLSVQSPAGWQTIVSIPAATGRAGWMTFDLPAEVEGSRFRIALSRPGDDARSITEVELWGTRPDRSPEVILGEPIATGLSPDLLFRLLPPRPGLYVLELIAGGPPRSKVAASLNGSDVMLDCIGTLGGKTLYRVEVEAAGSDADELWLYVPAGDLAADAVCRLRVPDRTGEWTVAGSAVLCDGSLVESEERSGTSQWILDRALVIDAVEVRGPSAGSALVRVLVDEEWVTIDPSSSLPNLVVFSCDLEIRGLELAATGGISEVTLLGSPTADVPPSIRIIQPEGQTAPRNAVLLGTVFDPSTSVTVNGVTPRRIGPFFMVSLDVADPDAAEWYRAAIRAADADERTAVVERRWIRSGLAPLTVDQTGALHSTMEATFEITGKTADAIYRVEVNGAPAPTVGNRFAVEVPVSVGYNSIVVTARRTSTGAIEAARLVRVIRSDARFGVEITSPVPETWVASSRVTVGGRLTGAVPPVTVEVNGVQADIEGDRFRTDAPVSLAEGENEIRVTARDGAGRTVEAECRVYLDSVPPVLEFVRPASGAILGSSIVNLEVRASDSNSVTVDIAGMIVAATVDRYELSVGFADGIRRATAVATDPAGNRGTAECTFMVDTTPPEPFLVTVAPGGWTGERSPVVSFTALDATSGISKHEISVDAGPGIAAASPVRIGPLADGVHSIEVTAFDLAGNARTAGAGAFIDTVAPPAPAAFRGIEGPDRVELAWEQSADDVVGYRIERTPAWDEGARSVTGLSLVDEGLEAGSTFTYRHRRDRSCRTREPTGNGHLHGGNRGRPGRPRGAWRHGRVRGRGPVLGH